MGTHVLFLSRVKAMTYVLGARFHDPPPNGEGGGGRVPMAAGMPCMHIMICMHMYAAYVHLHVHIYICMHCIRMQAYTCMACMHMYMPHPMCISTPHPTTGGGGIAMSEALPRYIL